MLVISRKLGTSIQIGNVLVTVLSKKGRLIRLGIEAPMEMKISRTEMVCTPVLSKGIPVEIECRASGESRQPEFTTEPAM